MNEEIVPILIKAGVQLGVDVGVQLWNAVKNGDVNTVAELSKVLPEAHQMALADEALIAAQRARAHEVQRRDEP